MAVSFAVQKLLSSVRTRSFIFAFVSFSLGEIKKYTHMAIIHVRVFCICCVLRTLYFGHLMRTDSFEKILMMGKVEGRRRRG